MSTPSMIKLPPSSSVSLSSVEMRDDLPAPVLPTIPTLSPPAKIIGVLVFHYNHVLTYFHTNPSEYQGQLRSVSEADISKLYSTLLRPVRPRSVGVNDGWGLLLKIGILKVPCQRVDESYEVGFEIHHKGNKSCSLKDIDHDQSSNSRAYLVLKFKDGNKSWYQKLFQQP